MSDLDQLVKDWQTAGGDKMRAEYQQAQDSAKHSISSRRLGAGGVMARW